MIKGQTCSRIRYKYQALGRNGNNKMRGDATSGGSIPLAPKLPPCLSPDTLKKDEELLNKLFNKQL